MEDHNKRVAIVAAQIRKFHERKEAFRIYHGSTNSTRIVSLERTQTINTGDFCNVVNIDRTRKTALVEPNVPMDQLVGSTLGHGLLPPVVMEFPGITVGGGFAGLGGESSSFKYGFFDRTVFRIQIVLSNGEVVSASSSENPDLFYGAARTFGSLGVITLLELQLIDTKPFVELTFQPVKSMRHAVEVITPAINDDANDYIDGILFAADRGVILTGRLSDKSNAGLSIQRLSRAKDPWFYIHAEDVVDRHTGPYTELIPIEDYLFRYDRGGFWAGKYAFDYFVTPFNRLTRYLFDPIMHARVMYRAAHQSALIQQHIFQDIVVPQPAAEELVKYIDTNLHIYPLWLCPFRPHDRHEISLQPSAWDTLPPKTMLLNIGVWGPVKGSLETVEKLVSVNRALETKIKELSGMKWLYANSFYTETEFWDIYDRKWYDDLRKKHNAESLPSVYEKVKIDIDAQVRARSGIWSIWPLSGLYGVAKAVLGSEYLL